MRAPLHRRERERERDSLCALWHQTIRRRRPAFARSRTSVAALRMWCCCCRGRPPLYPLSLFLMDCSRLSLDVEQWQVTQNTSKRPMTTSSFTTYLVSLYLTVCCLFFLCNSLLSFLLFSHVYLKLSITLFLLLYLLSYTCCLIVCVLYTFHKCVQIFVREFMGEESWFHIRGHIFASSRVLYDICKVTKRRTRKKKKIFCTCMYDTSSRSPFHPACCMLSVYIHTTLFSLPFAIVHVFFHFVLCL